MAMSCPDSETLHRFLLGRLPAWEIDGVSAHLESCHDCCSRLSLANSVDALLRLVQSERDLCVDRNQSPNFEDESACDRVIAALTVELVRHRRDQFRHDRPAESRLEREPLSD